MTAIALPPDDGSGEQTGFDQWGNKVWFWGDRAIRLDDSGSEPMFCLKDSFEVNGIKWRGSSNYRRLAGHKGVCSFYTPGGIQSLVTVTEEGFYILSMRGNRPISRAFQEKLAQVAKQLRKTGVAVAAMPVPASPIDLIVQQSALQHQQSALLNQIAVQFAEHSRRVDHLEERIDEIVERGDLATRQMMALPAPKVPSPARTDRHNVVEWVQGFCWSTGADHGPCWGKLYREIRIRLGIDVNARFRNNPGMYERKIDVVDAAGIMDKAYALAQELFPWVPGKVAE